MRYKGYEILRLRKPLNRNVITQTFGADSACIKPDGTGKVISVDLGTGLCPVGFMSVYKYLGLKGHNGTDFGCPIGKPLFAVFDGVVTEIETRESKGLGITITTEEPVWFIMDKSLAKAKICYWHLNLISVKVGDKIKKGQIIGETGNTGYSTGPHLHLGLYKVPKQENEYGGAFNPMGFMEDLTGADLLDYQARLRGLIYLFLKRLQDLI